MGPKLQNCEKRFWIVTKYQQAIWGHIWKRTMEKSQTNAINVILHCLMQVLWGDFLKSIMEKSQNKCNQCDHAFSDPSSLWRHLKTHNGENSNKCNQCDYASFQAGNLRTHLKTHSGEKLNKCNQYDFAYDLIYQSNLPSLPTYHTFLPDQPTFLAALAALYLPLSVTHDSQLIVT